MRRRTIGGWCWARKVLRVLRVAQGPGSSGCENQRGREDRDPVVLFPDDPEHPEDPETTLLLRHRVPREVIGRERYSPRSSVIDPVHVLDELVRHRVDLPGGERAEWEAALGAARVVEDNGHRLREVEMWPSVDADLYLDERRYRLPYRYEREGEERLVER